MKPTVLSPLLFGRVDDGFGDNNILAVIGLLNLDVFNLNFVGHGERLSIGYSRKLVERRNKLCFCHKYVSIIIKTREVISRGTKR